MRREAVLSSRIEGTLSSVSELFVFEVAPQEESLQSDVREVSNYVNALDYGLQSLERLPISLRLVRNLHEKLMQDVRGEKDRPGTFRRKQNWIGSQGCTLEEATYVPPPIVEMDQALDSWEKFVHDRKNIFPPLLQCAMLHYQFEAIHPFVDGNGRIGRLLILLLLQERGLLSHPLLYLSAYLEKNRSEYYDRLQAVSEHGDWEAWLLFFLRGVAEQSQDATETSQQILNLHKKYRDQLQKERVTASTLGLLDKLFVNPYITVPLASEKLGVTYPTAQKAVAGLLEAGILTEITERYRNRIYCAVDLLRVIAGEEPE